MNKILKLNVKMLKYLILFLLISITLKANAQSIITNCDTILIEELLNVDFDIFLGKKVQYFLTHDYVRKYKEYIFFDNKPFVLSGVMLVISDNFFIEIFVEKYNYLNQFNTNRKWDFELFKKERVSKIEFILNEQTILKIE